MEVDFDLPSAADIAAEMQESSEPASSAPDVNEADGVDIDVTPKADRDEGTDEAATAEAAVEDPAADAGADSESEDPTAEGDEEAGEETTEDPAEEPAKTGFQKRIDELTAAKGDAERQVAELREQLAAANARPVDPLNPFALVDNQADLDAAVEREEQFYEWTLAHEGMIDGADLSDGKGGSVHFEPDQIRQMKVNTYRILRTADKRREFLREKATRDATAAEVYPWLRATKEGPGAEVTQLVEARPYLRQSPDYRLLAADAVVGAKLRAAGVRLDEKGLAALLKGKAAIAPRGTAPAGAAALAIGRTTTPPIRRLAPSPGRPGVLPPKVHGREAAARVAGKAIQASDGDLGSVSDSIAAKLRW